MLQKNIYAQKRAVQLEDGGAYEKTIIIKASYIYIWIYYWLDILSGMFINYYEKLGVVKTTIYLLDI